MIQCGGGKGQLTITNEFEAFEDLESCPKPPEVKLHWWLLQYL